MPSVHPFRALQYRDGRGDVSTLVAPPYDVLDAAAKRALLDQDPANIVGIDLPHVPAKELGPPAAYSAAADALASLLSSRTLSRAATPAMFAYRQTFTSNGKSLKRSGMACCIDTVPFGPRPGGGVLAHEQTFGGPKEDRMALMRATRTQLSPIFGLHADAQGRATALLHRVMHARPADQTATLAGGVLHEVWTITDEPTIHAYQDALAGEDVFIADGHHRYTTGINYLAASENAGTLPQDHPARRCMFVLVGMQDPGLAIWPTHRVLGGMAHYSIERFIDAAAGLLSIEAIDNNPHAAPAQIDSIAKREKTNCFGLYDFATGLIYAAYPTTPDPIEDLFPHKPRAWRDLDVAVVQHLIVEQICQPALNDNKPVTWAFPHTIDEVIDIARGKETGSSVAGGGRGQLCVIVRPTPLDAVKDICLAGELMPQKSTFFYPKLATGLFLHPLE
jgi:uncharacterized protein (DUF1015 family)